MIRKLTILRTRVRADVQIGENEFGGAVVVTVELPRNAQEVQDATVSLENLLLRTAQEHLKLADQREQVRDLVDQKVKVVSETERVRITKDVEARNAASDRQRQEHIDSLQRQLDRQRDALLREVETAFYGAEFPGDRTQIMPVIVDVLRSKRNQEST